MKMRKKTDLIQILLIITFIIFIFEVFLNGPELLIFILLFGSLAYYGRQRMYKLSGKVAFWSGVVFLAFTVMNMTAFKFLLVAGIVAFLVKWYDTKKVPVYYQPKVIEEPQSQGEEILQETPFFGNQWFGKQQTKEEAYPWQDINIQAGIGDTVIDMTNTILPKEEAAIVIRNLVGNMEIFVPYEAEVSIHHSVVYGSVEIFGYEEPRAWNKVIHLQTENYGQTPQRVKIFTSMLTGRLEVKRK